MPCGIVVTGSHGFITSPCIKMQQQRQDRAQIHLHTYMQDDELQVVCGLGQSSSDIPMYI